MNPNRIKLFNVARKALFQRAQLQRSVGQARSALTPEALKRRAKRKAAARLDDALAASEDRLRRYALPLGLTALAGLTFAFRRPIANAATYLLDRFGGQPDSSPTNSPETDDEPV
jgi:hypothetical protein